VNFIFNIYSGLNNQSLRATAKYKKLNSQALHATAKFSELITLVKISETFTVAILAWLFIFIIYF
jgi:hypothetical protein